MLLSEDMACRLCFDLGLNDERSQAGLSASELQMRHLVLCACVVHDRQVVERAFQSADFLTFSRYWALFSGRSTCIESSDLAILNLGNCFESLFSFRLLGFETSFEMQVYRSLLSLMDLSGKIIEAFRNAPCVEDLGTYQRAGCAIKLLPPAVSADPPLVGLP